MGLDIAMRSEVLAKFDFELPRQQEFARLSGDWNPVHVDPVHARRTQAGSLLVHGVHVVCRCLEALAEKHANLPEIAQLAVRFAKPTLVGDGIAIVLTELTESEIRLQTCIGDIVTAQLTLKLASGVMETHALPPDLALSDGRTPRERSLTEIRAARGRVGSAMALDEICRHFPATCRWIGGPRIAALLCISRIVGMECPGLYSLLAGLALEFRATPSSSDVSYAVLRVNERLRRVKMAVEGLGVSGTVEGFVRHPPARQISFSEVAGRIEHHEFAGQSALVVGGSRGLGELTAKIVAAGGGHPILTYTVGEDDAKRVQAEIRSAGALCNVLRYDVRLPAKTQLEQLPHAVAYLYHYATGPIFRRKSQLFEPALLDEFLQFYVHGFQELCLALLQAADGRLSVFSPSSSAVSLRERPRGVTEYAMAKAASEVLCEELMRQYAGLKIVTARLPRLETDQTSSFVPAEVPNAIDILLPVVREVQSRGKASE